MATPEDEPAIGFITIPRAMLSVAAGVLDTVERAVVGDARVRTARGNAWDAICADRARAQARDDVQRLIAALAAAGAPTLAEQSQAGQVQAGHAQTVQAGHVQAGQAQPSVGSSPRSSASHATLVSTGSASRR